MHKGLNVNNVKKTTYVSIASAVAKVDKSGKVTAKKAGAAKIKVTVTLRNGVKKTISLKVTVK